MLDALKSLFENNAISEEIRAEIETAWNDRVAENKLNVTSELREEFAKKYEHDKAQMVEAIDAMVNEKLQAEISEFAEDRKQLAEQKAKYAVKMKEDSDKFKGFVFERLKSEISELHADQKVMAENFVKLEEFVVDALSKEIAEFNEDKQDVAETKVRLIREAKAHFEKMRSKFITKSADAVTSLVEKTLKKEISQLKEDIEAARKNDFGRRLFESYQQEYSQSFLNEKSETAKLLKVVNIAKQQAEDAKKNAEESQKIAEAKQAEIETLKESAEREKVINDLIKPLNTEQKNIMTNLLESVDTGKLQKQFDKYMPTVINGNTPAKKKAINEGTEITGDKQETVSTSASNFNNNVVDIKRLAGI
jgi:hypothetical protein